MARQKVDSHAKHTRASKEDYAYEQLREGIVSGVFLSGETLVQTQIAQQLGISAIPVRAAITRLIAEGLVTRAPHRPPQVAKPAIKELKEAYIIRVHLESLALREAIPLMSAVQLTRVKRVLSELDVALENRDMPRFGALNRRFHLLIYEPCSHRLLLQMITDLWDKTDRYRSRTMFSMVPNLAEQSQADHHRLFALIKRGATDDAVRLMEEHKARAGRVFLGELQQKEVGPTTARFPLISGGR
jgi:DNA-binding GntR family transcriptional regulator